MLYSRLSIHTPRAGTFDLVLEFPWTSQGRSLSLSSLPDLESAALPVVLSLIALLNIGDMRCKCRGGFRGDRGRTQIETRAGKCPQQEMWGLKKKKKKKNHSAQCGEFGGRNWRNVIN